MNITFRILKNKLSFSKKRKRKLRLSLKCSGERMKEKHVCIGTWSF